MRQRKSIVTGRILEDSLLIRFVVDPSGTVIPDIDADLPGRGAWIEASRQSIAEAVRKNLFHRAFKQAVNVAPDLADRAAARLRSKILNAIGLARKSGDVVFGLHNVEHAITRAQGGELLFEATDGKPEYRAQLAARLTERFGNPGSAETAAAKAVQTVTVFSSAELGLALGRDNVVHVWMKNQGIAQRVCENLNKLSGLERPDEPGTPGSPETLGTPETRGIKAGTDETGLEKAPANGSDSE